MRSCSPENTTVIICCAGMGTRLGIGTTKALVDIDGTPLLIRKLKLLEEYDDIRIVVGFQAERLIQIVKEYRKDIMFVFNYRYETTGVADSLRLALQGAREYIISLDGDVLYNPDDFKGFLSYEAPCLIVSAITSEEPILAEISHGMVAKLSKTQGSMQWPGAVKARREMLMGESSDVYDVLNQVLPLPALNLRTREINTQEDYEKALVWFEGGMED